MEEIPLSVVYATLILALGNLANSAPFRSIPSFLGTVTAPARIDTGFDRHQPPRFFGGSTWELAKSTGVPFTLPEGNGNLKVIEPNPGKMQI